MIWTKTTTAIVISACLLMAAGTTLLIIHHQRQPVQGIPDGWSVISGDPEQWSWADGRIYGHSTTGESFLASLKTYRDVTMSATLGSTNLEATMALRLQDANNGYLVLFIPDGIPNWDGRLEFFKKVDGEDIVLAHYYGHVFSTLGQSAKIGVSARGPWFEIRLNDVTVLRVKDSTFSSGFIGLRVSGDDESTPDDATFSNLTFY